jgi:cell division protein FtsQ
MRAFAANRRSAPRRNVNRRAVAVSRRVWVGRLTTGIWILAGAAAAVFASFFFVFVHDVFTQSPHFTARQIQVEGARRVPPRTVAALAGVREGINVLSVNLSAARRQLLAHPWIAEAEVRREIPSVIHIRVREHVPAAVVDMGKKFLLNEQGEIFKEWDPADPAGLPVVSGLKPADVRVADRSGAAVLPVMAALAPAVPTETPFSRPMNAVLQVLALGREDTGVLPVKQIAAIRVDRELGLTVVAYDDAKSIRLGYDDYAAKYRLLADLLAFFKGQPGMAAVARVDLTDAGRVIVNPVRADLPAKPGPKGG